MAKHLKAKAHKVSRKLICMFILVIAIIVVDIKTNFSSTIMNAIRTRDRSIQYK